MRFTIFVYFFTFIAIDFSSACECGLEGATGRIFRGTKTRPHKYPWIVHIRSYIDRKTGIHSQCGGTLVDDCHIITAAHCFVQSDGTTFKTKDIDIYLGRVMAFSDDNPPHRVAKVSIDKKFDEKLLSHDFAIVTLSKPVKFSQQIGAICLPNSEKLLSPLMVSGWGITSDKSGVSSDSLMEVNVSFVSREECNEKKKRFIMETKKVDPKNLTDYEIEPVSKTHICAINKETMGDACSGDSGGPLMHQGEDGHWYLMGIISGSWTECGQSKDTVGLYTRIHVYKETIKKLIPNLCWMDND